MRTIGAITLPILAITAGWPAQADAAAIQALHRFADTGKRPSHYSLGSTPHSELVQASDGNFYGTTVYGGAGPCPNRGQGGYLEQILINPAHTLLR